MGLLSGSTTSRACQDLRPHVLVEACNVLSFSHEKVHSLPKRVFFDPDSLFLFHFLPLFFAKLILNH